MFEKPPRPWKNTEMTFYLRRDDSWMENSYKWTGSPVRFNSVWSQSQFFCTHFCSPLAVLVVLPVLIPQSCYIARCPKHESSETHHPIGDCLETKETDLIPRFDCLTITDFLFTYWKLSMFWLDVESLKQEYGAERNGPAEWDKGAGGWHEDGGDRNQRAVREERSWGCTVNRLGARYEEREGRRNPDKNGGRRVQK